MLSIKKGIWFALTAVAVMTMMIAVRTFIVRGPGSCVIAFGGRDHENKNFNSFPIGAPEKGSRRSAFII